MAYCYLSFDCSYPPGTFVAVLKYKVRDCDPTTGLPDTDDGYNDEYAVSPPISIDLVLSFFERRLSEVGSFWRILLPQNVLERFNLNTNSMSCVAFRPSCAKNINSAKNDSFLRDVKI